MARLYSKEICFLQGGQPGTPFPSSVYASVWHSAVATICTAKHSALGACSSPSHMQCSWSPNIHASVAAETEHTHPDAHFALFGRVNNHSCDVQGLAGLPGNSRQALDGLRAHKHDESQCPPRLKDCSLFMCTSICMCSISKRSGHVQHHALTCVFKADARGMRSADYAPRPLSPAYF